MQLSLDLEMPKFPENPFKPGTHNHRVYEYLALHRKVDTWTIHHVLGVDCSRVNDCKQKLKDHKYDIPTAKPIPGEPGNYLYIVTRTN